MERVQSVKIRLSNGVSGIFWGAPIVEEEKEGLSVVDVRFDAPRYVGGISLDGQPVPVPAHGQQPTGNPQGS